MDAAVENYIAASFEKFRLLRKTERGEVWLAGAPSGEVVVLKRVFASDLPYELLKAHPHPLWPKILYCAEAPGETVVVEEFVAGVSLRERLERGGYFTEEGAARVLCLLCDGLSVLHGLGIVHRDIKPSNLILTQDGAIRLIDFDAARTQKENKSEDTSRLGTKGYAPPEQFGYGQTDARSDIYAVGVTMGKMLGPDYRGVLAPILARCAELDPKRRYASAAELKRTVLMLRRWAKAKKACPVLLAAFLGATLYFLPTPRVESPVPPIAPPPTENAQPPSPPINEEKPSIEEPQKDAIAIVPETPDNKETAPEIADGAEPDDAEPAETGRETIPAEQDSHPLTPDEEAEAFLAQFKDDPEKLQYWQTRKEGYFREIEKQRLSPKETEEAKREALDMMRRGELGLRAEAFRKTLPKNMTADEKGRAFNEFVFEQIGILGITDWY